MSFFSPFSHERSNSIDQLNTFNWTRNRIFDSGLSFTFFLRLKNISTIPLKCFQDEIIFLYKKNSKN